MSICAGSMLTTLAMFAISQRRMASSVGGSVTGAAFRFFSISRYPLGRLLIEIDLRLSLLGDLHRRRQSQHVAQLDHRPGDVHLPPLQPMNGGAGERVVVVVPRFSERRNGENHVVGAVVLDMVGLAAKYMADGVNAPSGVMHHQDPDQAAPQKSSRR